MPSSLPDSTIKIRLAFDKHVSARDIKAFNNFMKGKEENPDALDRLYNPIWKSSFDNYDYVLALFFDCLKDKYAAKTLPQGAKKADNKVTKENYEKICERYPASRAIQKIFEGRFI